MADSGSKVGRLSPGDPSSYSRPEECMITDLELDIHVDFSRKVIHGTGTYKAKRMEVGAEVLVMDTDDLKINRVYCKQTSQELQFNLSEPVGKLGAKLQIILLPSFDKEFEICIDFENSPSAAGLQWLSAEQTAGKRHPYLFSQFQSIYARTVVPCQDTPSVKHPYRAKVTVDKDLTVLMSAVPQGNTPADGDKTTYEFYQKIPIPSYLMAIAVGDLVSKKIGERSSVWTEKEMIDAAASEFDETDKMLKTAEDLCGPYVWGVYDLLVLPPSFPFGGMENPCLTFVTPTLLAGDKSATSVIAHEISHSWTGNLVTNKNWEDFWLNEGHTVYVERKIMGRLLGEKHRHFGMIGGWIGLRNAVHEELGVSSPLTQLVPDLSDVHPEDAFSAVPYERGSALLFTIENIVGGPGMKLVEDYGDGHMFTRLVPDLEGAHPDEAFSRVPYERGSALLFYIETQVGGAEVMEDWLRAYLIKFSGQSITTEQWKDFLYSYFHDKHDALNKIDWQMWLHTPGMPTVKPEYDYGLYNACETLSNRWISGDELPTDNHDFNQFSTGQKIEFLSTLLLKDPMPEERIIKLGELYGLPTNNNAEIKCRWLQLNLRAGSEHQLDATLQFVTDVGRMKFVRPIYKDLYKFEAVRQKAIDTFRRNRPQMHAITAKMVSDDLHLNE